MALPEKYQKTGIKVLDDLANAYRNGDDTDFLTAYDAFAEVAHRLEGTSWVPVEYADRLYALGRR